MRISSADLSRFIVQLMSDGQLPTEFALSQNYPNPFNPTTNIKYALPMGSKVTMGIYNVLGQKVRTLLSGDKPAGHHIAEWNGTGNQGEPVGSGVYFLHLFAQGTDGASFNQIRKLMMLK